MPWVVAQEGLVLGWGTTWEVSLLIICRPFLLAPGDVPGYGYHVQMSSLSILNGVSLGRAKPSRWVFAAWLGQGFYQLVL